MDRADKRSLLMAAGGAAVAGVSMMASQSIGGLEITNDVLEVIKTVLGFIPPLAATASAISLVQLAVKYGGKLYHRIKQKIQEKYHLNEKEADKMLKSLSNDTKSSSKATAKEGEMTDVMKKGFNRGASINNPPRRFARSPAIQKQTIENRQAVR